MSDPGAVPLGEEGSLGSAPVAEEEDDNGVSTPSRRNPSRVAPNETGEAPPNLGGGNGTVEIGKLNAVNHLGQGQEKEPEPEPEPEESVEALTLLSIQGSDETASSYSNAAAELEGPLDGSLHDDEPCSSTISHNDRGKAVIVTETSMLLSGAVAAEDHQHQQEQYMPTSHVEKDAAAAAESTTPLSSSSNNSSQHQHDKGKGREAPSAPETDPSLSSSSSSSFPKPSTSLEAEYSPTVSQSPPPPPPASAFQPLQVGEPGWEKSADRPPKKLPIRFKDAVGRKFVFPWERAKTWDGMKALIDSCFLHVDVVGPHVRAGHYDLMTSSPLSTGLETSQPATPASIGSPAAASPAPTVTQADGPASVPTLTNGGPSPSPPAAPSPPADATDLGQIILPEVWEDMVEPGMFITQHMWPLGPGFHQPPPLPPQHQPPPMPHAPFTPGRGRGRGRGGGGEGGIASRGRGRGHPHPHPPPPPPGMPLLPVYPHGPPIHIIDVSRSRPKSRKRPERP